MRFALCNEMFGEMDWPQALEITRACGYTGWEIAPFTLGEAPTKLSSSEREKIAGTVTSAGIEVIGPTLAVGEDSRLSSNDPRC